MTNELPECLKVFPHTTDSNDEIIILEMDNSKEVFSFEYHGGVATGTLRLTKPTANKLAKVLAELSKGVKEGSLAV